MVYCYKNLSSPFFRGRCPHEPPQTEPYHHTHSSRHPFPLREARPWRAIRCHSPCHPRCHPCRFCRDPCHFCRASATTILANPLKSQIRKEIAPKQNRKT